MDPEGDLDDGTRDLIDLSFMREETYNRIKDMITGKRTVNDVPIDKPIPPDENSLRIMITSKWGRRRAIEWGWI
jgi:hypothetical protein